MTEAGPLRWGILGCGMISEDFANVLLQYPLKHTISAVAARSVPRAEQFAKKFSVAQFGNYEILLQLEDVEVIYIGTVHTTHCEWAIKALEAGKHVVCEKPLAVTAREAEKMVAAARANKRFLLEAFWTRYFPSFARMKEEIACQSNIGKPEVVSVNFCQRGDRVGNPRLFDKGVTGGVTLDMGCYAVQFASAVFGGPDGRVLPQIQATGRLDESGVDLTVSATLKYPDERVAQLLFSIDADLGPSYGRISGSKGLLEVLSPFMASTKLLVNGTAVEFPLPGRTPKYPYLYSGANREGFCYMIACIYDCIRQGKTECEQMPLEESVVIAKILDEIRRQVGVVYDQDLE